MSKAFDKHSHLKEIPPGSQFDDTEPGSGNIFFVAIATIFFILVTIGGIYGYYSWFREKMLFERQLAPNSVELTTIRTREDQILNSYGYVEKDKGIVRLPVARAIELVLAESGEGKEKYSTVDKLIPPPKVDDAAPPVAGANPTAPAPAGTPAAPAAKH